jgi:hypothetical protein
MFGNAIRPLTAVAEATTLTLFDIQGMKAESGVRGEE